MEYTVAINCESVNKRFKNVHLPLNQQLFFSSFLRGAWAPLIDHPQGINSLMAGCYKIQFMSWKPHSSAGFRWPVSIDSPLKFIHQKRSSQQGQSVVAASSRRRQSWIVWQTSDSSGLSGWRESPILGNLWTQIWTKWDYQIIDIRIGRPKQTNSRRRMVRDWQWRVRWIDDVYCWFCQMELIDNHF